MPLDDTNWATSTADATHSFPAPRVAPLRPSISRSYRPRKRLRVSPGGVVAAVVVLGVVALLSEGFFPRGGMISRLLWSNAVANQNYTGSQIMRAGRWLEFTVAGHRYEVVAPSRTLTPDEQQALLGYAAWKGYPAYSADGPLTIDP
jgi:hypothetical protein